MLSRLRDTFAPYVPLVLRVGLGLVFLWSAFSKLVSPEGALGVCTNRAEAIDFVSTLYWLPFDPEIFVWVQTAVELVLGVLLVLGLWLELAAAAASLMLLSFFAFFNFNVVWKNLGLLGAAVAILGLIPDRFTLDSWFKRRQAGRVVILPR